MNPCKNKANPKYKREFLQKEGVRSCLACLYLYNLCKLSIIDAHFVKFWQKFTDLEGFAYIILLLCPRNQQNILSWRVKERRQREGEQKEKKNLQM